MAKGKRKEKRFLAFLCILTILITTIIPTNITYAATSQYEEVEGDITSENEGNSTEVEPADEESQEGCVLDDGLSIFDTYAQNVPFVAAYEECTPQEKKVVNEVVVFISFSDLGENIYEERGGYDYILNMFDGGTPSLKSYVDEYSWGQVEVNTTAWPQNSNGTALCYVDDHPASYYLKQTSSNPNGYTSTQKSSRRSELLNKAIAFMGDDFLEKMGIEDEPYNLVFMVPKCGSWNDLLWSHKSTITVDGKSTIYNMITYETKEKYITRTITHEFMHSLGFPDLYRYYTDTSANPVSLWSIMGSTSATVGHPLVYEKNKYGDWLGEGNGIKTIKKSGHYELKPSTSDPDENTIAYQIPVEGVTNQYFMVEYRGHSSSGYDTALGREGLIFYRINTTKKGNGYGPPDEIYVLRNTSNVYHAYFDGSEGKTGFSGFYLYEDTTELGISVINIKLEDGVASFDIEVPYVGLEVSKESPVSVSDSTKLVLSTDSLSTGNYTYRFGVIANGVEYELSDGYQNDSSIEVNLFDTLGKKVLGTHTLFVDVKNGSTGKVKRGTISDYTVEGTTITEINSNLSSPQKIGTEIKLTAVVENEEISGTNTYQFVVEKDSKKEVLTMSGNYIASWTPAEAGIYTIRFSVTDAYGITATKEIQYPIGTDTTAYVFYKNSSWSKAYIHYKIGSGAWTTSPGVQMAKSTVDGYSWIYLLELNGKTGTACFNNGNGTWDNNDEKDYTIKNGVNSIGGTSLTLSGVTISEKSIEKNNCQFSASVKGGIAPFTYDYTIKSIDEDTVLEEKSGMLREDKTFEISSDLEKPGDYVLSVTVKDAYGQTQTKEHNFELEKFKIKEIRTSVFSPQLPETEITLTAEWENAYVNENGISVEWRIKNWKTEKIFEETISDEGELLWKPTDVGIYAITATITDSAGEVATETIYYEIVEEIINQAVIYYGNTSWNQAYIHYRIGEGDWTKVPGVVMEVNEEQSGYGWKYVLELGEATEATVCFNNGNDLWDSRDELNYPVSVGIYGIKEEKITMLNPVITVTESPTPSATETVEITATPDVMEGEITRTPSISETPNIVVTPGGVTDSTGTQIEMPEITSTPKVTKTPEVTGTPEVANTPEVTKTPEVTSTPKVTKTPEVTGTPEVMKTPEITETPQVTKTPEVTHTSKVTKTPEVPNITMTPVITDAPFSSLLPNPTISPAGAGSADETKQPQNTMIPNNSITINGNPTIVPSGTGTTITTTMNPPEEEEALQNPVVGMEISDNETEATYRICMVNGKKAVEYMATVSDAMNIHIPDSIYVGGVTYEVRKISAEAFKNNKTIKVITIGKNVTVIGKSAFYGCTNLQKVKKGVSVQKVEEKAFYGCDKLESIYMSASLTKIGAFAFYQCKSLKNMIIPEKVGSIGKLTFYGCKNLKDIEIKTKKLTKYNVGKNAFKKIYSKATIKVVKGKVKVYKEMLRKKGIGKKAKF